MYEQLHKIKDSIVHRTPLTDIQALRLYSMTSTPIYQMIAQSIHSGRGSTILADRIIDSFAEVIATEIAFRQMNDLSKEVEQSLRKLESISVKGHLDAIKDFREGMKYTRDNAVEIYAILQEDVAKKMDNITMMLDFQRQMYTSLGPRLTSNIEFGKKL